MAWVLRVEAGNEEDEQRSFPVGDSRIRVCNWGLAFCKRNVDSRFVKSIACDMVNIDFCGDVEEVSQ